MALVDKDKPADTSPLNTTIVRMIREDRGSHHAVTRTRATAHTNNPSDCNALAGAHYGTVSLNDFSLRSTSCCVWGSLTVQRSEWLTTVDGVPEALHAVPQQP